MFSQTLGDQLGKFIQRIEALEEEKAGIMAALKEVFQEAKGEGVDIRALKELLKLRKLEQLDLQEQQSTLKQYLSAVGMSAN
ncbi:DUF2312 domain-containing protein [bacterium]|nr:DUF2312 domain-containing protein [bacterium]